MDNNNLEQFKDIFMTESYEFLDDMENRLMNLQPDCSDLEELNAIFRCAHSIKGSSAALGFDNLAKFTHVVETLLDYLREGKLSLNMDIIEVLLSSHNILTQMVSGLRDNVKVDTEIVKSVQIKLENILSNKQENITCNAVRNEQERSKLTDKQNYQITFIPSIDALINGNEPLLIIRELKKIGDLESKIDIKELPDLKDLNPKHCYIKWFFNLNTEKTEEDIKDIFQFVELNSKIEIKKENILSASQSVIETQIHNNIPKKASISSIRVDTDKVDNLVNMIGELIITQSMIYDQIKHLPQKEFQGLIRGLDDLFNHSKSLQESIMAVRMQPVKSIFSRLPRLVRDLSTQLGKQIRLETFGETTEVDKTVIEQLSDPLTHMIRNSVDHGIESPEQRLIKNKNLEGTIKIEAYHRGGRIIIEVSDDGAGINRDKVLQKAKSKKLIPEDANLTSKEIDQLIFLPGLSTTQKVTDISGRGVGMDVVKRNIESLGGSIEIVNNEGIGAKFILSLPLTLAILDGMVVRCANEFYIIPIISITETLDAKKYKIESISTGKEVINIRGEFIPVINLRNIFNLKNNTNYNEHSLIILLENEEDKFGLIVDELIGQQQVVIKNIEENSIFIEGISGATILGNGKVSFILDITKLESLYNKYSCSLNPY